MTVASSAAAVAATAPGPLEPDRTFYFRSGDGVRLYGELFEPDNASAAAVVLHGYAEHCGRYRELAHVLARAGITVMSFDMRGHGRSDGQRGLVQRFTDYVGDMESAISELDSRGDAELPLAIVAHSNGALVTLRALADPWRRPKRARVAALSSPFLGLKLRVSGVRRLTAQLASITLPSLTLPNELHVEQLTSDPGKQNERRLDTLCHDVASARWYTEAQSTQQFVLEFANRIDVPTLWLVAGSDKIADPDATRAVHQRLVSESEYHEFPDLEHEVFNEIDRARVFGLLADYLKRHLSLQS